MDTASTANRCPATGRSASGCADPTHAACYAGQRDSIALDRRVERQLEERAEAEFYAAQGWADVEDGAAFDRDNPRG